MSEPQANTWDQEKSEHLPLLRKIFPRAVNLKPQQVADALGSKRQTVYNQVCENRFPVKIKSAGPGKKGWACSILDVARYLDTDEPQEQLKIDQEASPVAGTTPKKKMGRPVKPHYEVITFWNDVVTLMRIKQAREEAAELKVSIGNYPYPKRPIKRLGDD